MCSWMAGLREILWLGAGSRGRRRGLALEWQNGVFLANVNKVVGLFTKLTVLRVSTP